MSLETRRIPTLHPSNRKYLGAKTTLLPWLLSEIQMRTDGRIGTFCEPMAGTGVVAYEVARLPTTQVVIAGDILLSNTVPLGTFLSADLSEREVARRIAELSSLEPAYGYLWRNFGGRYFTHANAAHMDAIREAIAQEPDARLADAMLTSLIYAADKAANTVGQFDAYMKNLNRGAEHKEKHLVDRNALKPLDLRVPVAACSCHAIVHTCDAKDLLRRFPCDIVYLDPPYNTRQYADLYHVLENIARWEKPPLYGITRKFRRDHLRSAFSSRYTACDALKTACEVARCRHLFLSYSSEGIVPHSQILSMLSSFGPVEVSEMEYPVFGRGAGRARKRTVLERLYYVRKR